MTTVANRLSPSNGCKRESDRTTRQSVHLGKVFWKTNVALIFLSASARRGVTRLGDHYDALALLA